MASELDSYFISQDFVKKYLTHEEAFHTSHGCHSAGFLGAGMLYYALAYMLESDYSVCLGSGSGFVPRLMRQAQLDLNLAGAETVLIDANLPEAGWGSPDYHHRPTFFTRNWNVTVVNKTTRDALTEIRKPIRYLHIDADHSYEWAKHDFETYSKLCCGLITLHDSIDPNCGVPRLLNEIERDYEILNIPLGHGTAVVKSKTFDAKYGSAGIAGPPWVDDPSAYRQRLLPIIARWREQGTRVAVFGTGPHTDYLFRVLPELEQVAILAYLDTRFGGCGQVYRDRPVQTLAWAPGRVDVVLCSSFANEATQLELLGGLAVEAMTSQPPRPHR